MQVLGILKRVYTNQLLPLDILTLLTPPSGHCYSHQATDGAVMGSTAGLDRQFGEK